MSDVAATCRQIVRSSVGAPIFIAQHIARQRYLSRSSRTVEALDEAPPAAGPNTEGSVVQRRDDGTGPLIMRTYRSSFRDARISAPELLSTFLADPNDFSPREIAGFRTPGGNPATGLELGDEAVVEIPGPWNGPVRVDAVDDCSMTLITLDGHMEAGHIRFSARSSTSEAADVFEIRSWARAGDSLFEFIHVDAAIAHEAQTAMWAHTCDRAIRIAGGSRDGPIRVATDTLRGSEL